MSLQGGFSRSRSKLKTSFLAESTLLEGAAGSSHHRGAPTAGPASQKFEKRKGENEENEDFLMLIIFILE